MTEYKINSDLTVKLEQRTHYLQINFYVRGELINGYLSKLPKEEIRLIFVELLNQLIILGDLASKSKLKIEDRDELNAKIEVFFRFLDNPHITNFNNVLYENVLRHPKLDLITKYLVRIDKKKGDQLTSKLQKIALHRYPPDKWVKKLKRWIKEITIHDLALALDRRVLDFLPETYFKALFIDNNFELVDKLIFIDKSRKYLGRIGNISPEIYSNYFEQCYMKSEFIKILTILNISNIWEGKIGDFITNPYSKEGYLLKTDSIKELVAYPHSKVIEIVAKSLKGALKKDACVFISRHPWIYPFLSNELKDFTEKEIYDAFYYLLEQDYLSGFREQDIENLFGYIDPKILKKLPTKIIDKFIEYLRKINFDGKSLDGCMSMFLYSFKKFSFTNQVFKTEINRLIELNQPIILFLLWNMDLLDYYSLEEKINFFSKFEFPVLAEESLKFHGGESIALNLDKFVALGDYGPDFIIRLFINHEIDTEPLYYIFNNFIKDHFDIFKEGIINSFIKLEYPQVKDLFQLEAISKLSKEDIRKIIEPSPSRFYEKLNLAIEDNYSYAMLILKHVGKEGIPLFFKYLSLYEQFGDVEIEIFKEYGKDVIEPFIQEVILNVHNYSYNDRSDVLSFLYDLFLDLFDDQQLKQLILKDDYKLIEMINKSNQRYYVLSSFFYLVYKRLDDETVLQIHNRFSDKYKQECIEYFVIYLIEVFDEKEWGQYLRILSLVGNLFQAINLAKSIAEYSGFAPLSSELSNKLEVITIKNPQKLIKTLGDTLVFILLGDDELSKIWFGVKFHGSIKERLIGRILDELEDIYRNVVNGAYSNDDESWVNILVKFFEMVKNLGHFIIEGLTDYFKDYESVNDSIGNQVNRAMDALIGAFPVVFENLVDRNEMAYGVLIKIGRGNNKQVYEFKLNSEFNSNYDS